VSLLDFINFLLAISFYILAKSRFWLVIFREALGVALSGGRSRRRRLIPSRYGVGGGRALPGAPE
jgi:hypothetical protein